MGSCRITQGDHHGALWHPGGWDGVGTRARPEEGTHMYLWLIHVDGRQKPTQHCKVIILQLKINFKKAFKKIPCLHFLQKSMSEIMDSHFVYVHIFVSKGGIYVFISFYVIFEWVFWSKFFIQIYRSQGYIFKRLIFFRSTTKLGGNCGDFSYTPPPPHVCHILVTNIPPHFLPGGIHHQKDPALAQHHCPWPSIYIRVQT